MTRLSRRDFVRLGAAGRSGSAAGPGRLRVHAATQPHRRSSSGPYLPLIDRVGVELPSFGDATERLAGI